MKKEHSFPSVKKSGSFIGIDVKKGQSFTRVKSGNFFGIDVKKEFFNTLQK